MQSIETSQVHLSPSIQLPLSAERVDALKEVANIGAGHAATALSLMTGARIMIDVPTINVAPLDELIPGIAEEGSQVVSVLMDMHGSLKGHTLLHLRQGLLILLLVERDKAQHYVAPGVGVIESQGPSYGHHRQRQCLARGTLLREPLQ